MQLKKLATCGRGLFNMIDRLREVLLKGRIGNGRPSTIDMITVTRHHRAFVERSASNPTDSGTVPDSELFSAFLQEGKTQPLPRRFDYPDRKQDFQARTIACPTCDCLPRLTYHYSTRPCSRSFLC